MELLNTSRYHSGTRYDYDLNGKLLIRVTPQKRAAEPCPWVWRAEFFDAFPQVDIALLERGYEIIYYCLSDMYGCPEAVKQMKLAHDTVCESFALDQKANIFGFSRGGLYACNYSVQYPDDIRLIYLDAPVLDIRSWPLCTLEASKCNRENKLVEAKQCLEWYGITIDQADEFKDSPIHKLDKLKSFPILLIVGEADTAVPVVDNAAIMYEALKDGDILYIKKPGCEHWPHSLEDPTPAVEFIEAHRG